MTWNTDIFASHALDGCKIHVPEFNVLIVELMLVAHKGSVLVRRCLECKGQVKQKNARKNGKGVLALNLRMGSSQIEKSLDCAVVCR